MWRILVALCGCVLLLAAVTAVPAWVDELPMRKAGYWEQKSSVVGLFVGIVLHECVDVASEKKLGLTGDVARKRCSKINIQRTWNGYVLDKQCEDTIITHLDITGSFDSSYTMKITDNIDKKSIMTTTEAKWLGACPAGWKPGDKEMQTLFEID